MGQLETQPIGRWMMLRNLIIKHDPRVRSYHPSSARNETRRDIVERGARKRYRSERETFARIGRGHAEGFELYAAITLYCTYDARIRALGISRIIWLMGCDERGGEGGNAAWEKERTDPRVFVYRVYSSGNGKRSHPPVVYIASISCCARINREMMRPAHIGRNVIRNPVAFPRALTLAPRH